MRPKKTILLLDPNEQSRSRNRFLLDLRGFRVLSASTCADASDILATELPELLWVNVRDVLLHLAPISLWVSVFLGFFLAGKSAYGPKLKDAEYDTFHPMISSLVGHSLVLGIAFLVHRYIVK